jgi:hypothetical protein
MSFGTSLASIENCDPVVSAVVGTMSGSC